MNTNLKEMSKDELINIIETLIEKVNNLEKTYNQRIMALEERNRLLEEENKLLKEENKSLRSQLKMNSSNSSMPPSTDGFKKKLKNNSLRKKTDKNSGGQPNHKGCTLEKVERPDFIVELKEDVCPHCSENIENVPSLEVDTRQVLDIPIPKIEVTEYRSHSKKCPSCGKIHSSKFPDNVTQNTSYGLNLKTLITYLNIQNHIPYKRIKEFVNDFFQQNISEGTIYNTLNKAYANLETTEEIIKRKIIESPQLHVDETGLYVEELRYWMFVHSTNNYTHYDFHKKRGKEAMDVIDILPNFKGIATHDCWKPYEKYDQCEHSLCNAHLLRELIGIKESTDFNFPDKIISILLEMKKLIDSGVSVSEKEKTVLISRYELELKNSFFEEREENIPIKIKGKRGKPKQSKAKNLLDRLSRTSEVLGFFINPDLIPFDNNLAERDIRMVKVKQKVSGRHRSEQGAKQFCRIRGYISTVRKNNLNIWDCLRSVFIGNPIMPQN